MKMLNAESICLYIQVNLATLSINVLTGFHTWSVPARNAKDGTWNITKCTLSQTMAHPKMDMRGKSMFLKTRC